MVASVLEFTRRRKVYFTTVLEAKLALSCDRLGTVYTDATTVFVVTSFGVGKFDRTDWEEDHHEAASAPRS